MPPRVFGFMAAVSVSYLIAEHALTPALIVDAILHGKAYVGINKRGEKCIHVHLRIQASGHKIKRRKRVHTKNLIVLTFGLDGCLYHAAYQNHVAHKRDLTPAIVKGWVDDNDTFFMEIEKEDDNIESSESEDSNTSEGSEHEVLPKATRRKLAVPTLD